MTIMSEAGCARISLVDAHAVASAFSALRPHRPASPVTPPEPDRFALGFVEGERAATEAFALERAALLRLFAAADAWQPEPSEELAAMIATTVAQLVTAIVGATPVDPVWLGERIDRAMRCIEDADGARTLWLNPEDLALVADTDLQLDLRADDSLERGALRLGHSAGWIEDGRSRQLAALRASLGTASTS